MGFGPRDPGVALCFPAKSEDPHAPNPGTFSGYEDKPRLKPYKAPLRYVNTINPIYTLSGILIIIFAGLEACGVGFRV